MAKIKLAALDVDGTLVRSDLSISPAVVASVESLRSAGVEVAVVTGRSLAELKVFRELLPWIRYFVVSNGATGFDAVSGQNFYENHMPLEIARAIELESRNYSLAAEVYADGVAYVNADCWRDAARYHTEYLHHPTLACGRSLVEDVGALLAARESGIEKFYICFEHADDLPKLEAYCRQYPVDLICSAQGGLEVNQRGVEKGSGLVALCDYLGLTPDQVAAVGDAPADVAMFQHAGLSIAMGNASRDVQAGAMLVAPSNDCDGASWAIAQILQSNERDSFPI